MMRGLTITTLLAAAAIEPTLSVESDPFRYAITQGGLLAVVLVLLWYIRNRHKAELDEERKRTVAAEQQIAIVVALVAETNKTMQHSIGVGEAQEKATHRLARAVERLEDRRAGGDRRGGD